MTLTSGLRAARPRRVAAAFVLTAALLAALPGGSLHGAVRPPHLQYDIYRLPNGLTVILSEDHSTPIVHVELWYHVGSKNERAGRTGFAHLFEHMMFQGSRNVEPEAHMSFISAIGGQTSAYTTEDVTVYYQTAPAHYLPLLLWLEADRMATLRIDRSTFEREREVVKEERLTRVDNPPYGRLPEIIYQHAFTTHPYRHQTIGSMADLNAASIDDVRDFYRTYYVPTNATLTIVGDFDPGRVRTMVERYFGRIPRPANAVPRDIPSEPAMTAERRITVEENWPLATVVVAHHIPHDGHPDSYPLHIATKILSDGRSSRLYRSLVYEQRLAYAAFGGGNILEHPNLFFAVARVPPGRSTAEAERALIAELDRLKTEPISEHELQRAKNQFARDYILNRESIASKASQLAHAAVIHDDIGTADGEFEIFASMTVGDIQRAARAHFRPENRLVLTVMPRGQRAPQRESR
jgi:zinc protease